MLAPVGPLSVKESPAQIVPSLAMPDVSVAVIVGEAGPGLTVTAADAVAVQPVNVTVTV